jgi:hypothetical protein
LVSLGDGSTLTLDFTTGILDSRLSFTRLSDATFINSSGLVTSVGNNIPRFDHDPTTLAPRGLLIEGSASNLWTYSQDQSQWAVNNVTVNTGTQATAPDGATSLFPVLTNNTGSVQYFVRQRSADTISATSGQTYTYSMFVKKGTHRYVQMFASAIAIFTIPAQANFDLDDGTTGNVTNCTANAVSYSNGWWRLSITVTANSTASQTQPFLMYLVSSKTAARSEVHSLTSASVYVWGAQLETGSGASSYIPTGASQATRALDSCYIAGTNFTSWFSAGAGTVVAQSDNVCIPAVGSQNLVGNFSDSTNSNYLRMGDRVGGGTTELLLTSVGGSIQGVSDSGFTPTLNTAYKSAYAWDTNNFACCANGGAVGTDVSGTLAGAGVITSLTIGGDFYQTSGPNSIYMKNGHIRLFKYWPTRLPNATLQSLTT